METSRGTSVVYVGTVEIMATKQLNVDHTYKMKQEINKIQAQIPKDTKAITIIKAWCESYLTLERLNIVNQNASRRKSMSLGRQIKRAI